MEIVTATVRFKDGETQTCKIAIGANRAIAELDREIFFFCESESEYDNLWLEDNGEDFFILYDNREYEIPYMTITKDDITNAVDDLVLTSQQMRRVAAEMSDVFLRDYFTTMRDVIINLGYDKKETK